MEITECCAMCGKERLIKVTVSPDDEYMTVREFLESNGWIVQRNGSNVDIYCSKACAE